MATASVDRAEREGLQILEGVAGAPILVAAALKAVPLIVQSGKKAVFAFDPLVPLLGFSRIFRTQKLSLVKACRSRSIMPLKSRLVDITDASYLIVDDNTDTDQSQICSQLTTNSPLVEEMNSDQSCSSSTFDTNISSVGEGREFLIPN